MMSVHKLKPLFDVNVVRSIFYQHRLLSKKILTASGKEVPKKKIAPQNKITLISPDNSITITDLKSAESLSLRRDLKLVKIVDIDVKTKRPVYKLMTSTEYHQEELQRRKEKQEARQNTFIKGEKLLTFSPRINNNDLMTGIRKMLKLLEKQYEVRVVISGHDEEIAASENILSTIESNIRSVGQVVQKRTKGKNLKFQLVPLRENCVQASPNASSPHGDPNEKSDKGVL